MKHHITTVEAVALISIIARIKAGVEKSPAIAAAYDITSHDLSRIDKLLKRLGK